MLARGGGAHYVDAIAEKHPHRFLISFKWQQSDGTAEQKIPFELMCLADAVRDGGYDKAYLVLGGTDRGPGSEGWTLRHFYTSGALQDYLFKKHTDVVEILTLEQFVARANKGRL